MSPDRKPRRHKNPSARRKGLEPGRRRRPYRPARNSGKRRRFGRQPRKANPSETSKKSNPGRRRRKAAPSGEQPAPGGELQPRKSKTEHGAVRLRAKMREAKHSDDGGAEERSKIAARNSALAARFGRSQDRAAQRRRRGLEEAHKTDNPSALEENRLGRARFRA
jgi:hypothetical protein